jgi:outer membrane protein assembly factor BamA
MRARRSSHTPVAIALGLASLFCVAVTHESRAQPPNPDGRSQQSPNQETEAALPQTRTEAIARERAEKLAELWPERQNAMVDLVNGYAERGLKEGLDSGKGANGLQLTLGGMRAAQGMSYGIGYRRSDFFRDQLGYRATARGTIGGAYMLDLDLDFQGMHTERTYLRWYTKYEHSPSIDFFGIGNDTTNSHKASYRFDDLSSDFSAGIAPTRSLRVGLSGGYYRAHTATSEREEFPPIDVTYPPEQLTGFAKDTQYTRIGGFAYLDSRDSLTGPRQGTFLGVRYREYWDIERKEFAFRQTEYEFQQYIPYYNRSRVVALRAAVTLSFPKGDNVVPIYLQPMLGGSDELRGFVPYRFRDYHAFNLGAEHRWHAFSTLDMAVFADAGKVVALKKDLDPTDLHYSGGLGFRFRLRSAIVTRLDFAGSTEGFRIICTFSDVFKVE